MIPMLGDRLRLYVRFIFHRKYWASLGNGSLCIQRTPLYCKKLHCGPMHWYSWIESARRFIGLTVDIRFRIMGLYLCFLELKKFRGKFADNCWIWAISFEFLPPALQIKVLFCSNHWFIQEISEGRLSILGVNMIAEFWR